MEEGARALADLIWDRGRRRTAEDVHRARPSSATVDTQPGGAQYPGDLTRRTEAGSSPGNGPWQEAQADDLAEVERSTESFHFYLDRLVFKYNTDEEEGLNGNNNVVWYEILQTLPDQMMRRVEGFWRQESAKGNPDPRKFFSHLAQTFGSVQQTERAQDRLRTSFNETAKSLGSSS
ncbi:hypothetical protein HRG_014512 [Hirsutella rhossiliensis]